jgi:hypothetical protein
VIIEMLPDIVDGVHDCPVVTVETAHDVEMQELGNTVLGVQGLVAGQKLGQ